MNDGRDLGALAGRPTLDPRRHIIDELLYERTETLRKAPFLWEAITACCLPFLKYREAVDWADRLGQCSSAEAYRAFADFLDLELAVTGLENIPRSGRLLIVANHPTGIVDALAIHDAIGDLRPDACYFSNRDLVRIVPSLSDFVIPLEWLRRRRTRSALQETFEAVTAAFAEDRAVVVFPAGGIARGGIGGLKELEWLAATIKLMRRYACPVVPIHIRARNSFLYYALEAIHPELRDLLRFREVFGKRRQRFEMTIGSPIEQIPGPLDEAVAALQAYVERDLSKGAAWPEPAAI